MLRLLLSLTLSAAFLAAAEPTVPELVDIPAGEFQMGSDKGHNWEKPVHTVHTSSFNVTARPVTNSQYRAFRPEHSSVVNGDESPVTGVSWKDAQEYAGWLSAQTGRSFALPSEARWERAVRGGLEQQDYPWGNQLVETKQPSADGIEPTENAFGVRAVGYNLWEWTADWYAADYFASSPADDPQGPPEGSFRVLRGGGYRDDPASASTYTRGSARPDTRSEHITFRLMEIVAAAAPEVSAVRPPTPTPTPAPASVPAPQEPPVQTAVVKPEVQTPARSAEQPAPKPTKPAASATSSGAVVNSIAVEGAGSSVTVRVRGLGTLGVKSFALSGPDRIVVDVAGAEMKTSRKFGEIPVALAGVTKVRYALFQPDPPIIRIVIDAERKLKHLIETRPDGFVVRIGP